MFVFKFYNITKFKKLLLQPELIERVEDFKRGRDLIPKLPPAIDVNTLKL